MSSQAQPPGRRAAGRRRRLSRIWHRWIGALIVLPLLFISVTGILLNHTTEFGWDEARTESPWILERYDMVLEGKPVTFRSAQDQTATQWNDSLFWNGRLLDADGHLLGAVALEDGHAIILDRSILLLASDGSLIEQLAEESLPTLPIRRAGLAPGDARRLVVESSGAGQSTFSSDLLTFESTSLPPTEVAWSSPISSTPSALVEKMERSYRGDGVPWSRVLLDMHSGRFFGTVGRWVADLVVLLLVVLSITGLRLLLRNRRPAASSTTQRES